MFADAPGMPRLLAAFGTAGAWVMLRVADGGRGAARWAVAGAILLATGSGFRSEVAPFLAPLWSWAVITWPTTWRVRGRTVIGSVAAGLAVGATWYLPMVQATGGMDAYAAATGGYYAYFIERTSGAGKQLLGVLENLRALVNCAYAGLGPSIVVLVADLGTRFRPTRIVTDRSSRVLAIWMVPPVAFYLLVHLGNPGYLLTILPACAIIVAVGTRDLVADGLAAGVEVWRRFAEWQPGGSARTGAFDSLSRETRPSGDRDRAIAIVTGGVVSLLALANGVLFLVGPGEGRRREISGIDEHFERVLGAIQSDYPAASTLVVAYDRSRQYRYYLPGWRHELLFDVAVAGAVTDTTRYWEWRRKLAVPDGVDWVVFPDLGDNLAESMGLVVARNLGSGEVMWVAAVRPGDEVTWGYRHATARRPH